MTRLKKIDPWKLIQTVLECELVRVCYLHGVPGIGKSYAAYEYGGKRLEKGFYAVTLTEETPAAELRGHFLFKGKETIWHDGPFTRAMREGCRLVINEISHASVDCLSLLYPVLESEKTAHLTLPTGETVRPAPGFHAVVTDNRPPDELPDALRDRMSSQIHVPGPHPDALAMLSPQIREALLSTIDVKDGRRLSLRGCLEIEKLRPQLGLQTACAAVYGLDQGHHIYEAILLAEAAA